MKLLLYFRTELRLRESSVVEVFRRTAIVIVVIVVREGLRMRVFGEREGGGLLPVPPRLAHLLDEHVDDGLHAAAAEKCFARQVRPLISLGAKVCVPNALLITTLQGGSDGLAVRLG